MDHVQALPSGYELSGYRLMRILGSGGFGITYLAEDLTLARSVAIKEYFPSDLCARTDGTTLIAQTQDDKEIYDWGLERFLEEARTLAQFSHQAIVRVTRFFPAHGTAYLVMEYLEGETLSSVLKREGKLSEERMLEILYPLMEGLEQVHDSGVLHRDIKPGNIIIRPDGAPVLIDFGAARQAIGAKSRSVTAVVTPGYAPIEQYSSKRGNQGPWTDVYALAAVAYRALTGQTPEDATDRVMHDDVQPVANLADVSPVIARAIDCGLALREADRPQSLNDWRIMLQGGDAPKPARSAKVVSADIVPETDTKSRGIVPIVLSLGLLSVLIGGGGLGWMWYNSDPAALQSIMSSIGGSASDEAEGTETADNASTGSGGDAPSEGAAPPRPQEINPADGAAWNAVDRTNAESLQDYLSAFPNGAFVADARAGLASLADQADDAAWAAVDQSDALSIRDYLRVFPDGRNKQAAAGVLRLLEPREWRAAEAADDAQSYRRYLASFADGAHAEEAKARLQAYQDSAAEEAAWSQALSGGRVSDFAAYLQEWPQGPHAREADDRAWERARSVGTEDALDVYAAAFPRGVHAGEVQAAKQAIRDGVAQARAAEDDAAWARAVAGGAVGDLKSYADAWPEGRHAREADDLAWQLSRRADTEAALDRYAAAFPDGAYVSDVEPAKQAIRDKLAALERRRPGRRFQDCASCPEMVVVPAGSFMMGSPAGESKRSDNEGAQRRVSIAQPFAVGRFEVTFAEWEACVKGGGCDDHKPGDEGWGRARRPVINVSWNDAVGYTQWLSRQTGESYRLLSEAEWEYAARAGTGAPFNTGERINANQANFNGEQTYNGSSAGTYRRRTLVVGSFAQNAFGLHDMHGNVREWVLDCPAPNYSSGQPSDGSAYLGPNCKSHIYRGGSWADGPQALRSAIRLWDKSKERNDYVGFRVTRPIE